MQNVLLTKLPANRPKEATSDKMYQAIKKFSDQVNVNDLSLLNKFLNACSGKVVAQEDFDQLKQLGLADKDPRASCFNQWKCAI